MRIAGKVLLGGTVLLGVVVLLFETGSVSFKWCKTTTHDEDHTEVSEVRGVHDLEVAQGVVFSKQRGPAEFVDRSGSELGPELLEGLRNDLMADPETNAAILYVRIERNELAGAWTNPFHKQGSASLVVHAEVCLQDGDDPVQRKGALKSDLDAEVVGISSRRDALSDVVERERKKVTAFIHAMCLRKAP